MRVLDKFNESISLFEEGQSKINEAHRVLSSGPAPYYYKKINEYATALFSKYAPFQEGDRVSLTRHPNTDNGWRHCRHFLIPGAQGVVQEVDYTQGVFCAGVVFDNETWIDSDGNEQPVTGKHAFKLSEKSLKKVGE